MVIYAVIVVAVLAVLVVPSLLHKTTTNTLTYNTFLTDIQGKQVKNGHRRPVHRRDHRHPVQRGQLHGQRAQPGRRLGAHRPQAAGVQLPPGHPAPRTPCSGSLELDPPVRPHPRHLLLHQPKGAGSDGKHHVDRPVQGQALLHRAPVDHLRRRGRLRRGQARDQRGGRLPQDPGPVQGDRGPDPQGHPAGRPPGHRQDPAGPGRGRRGRGARSCR